MAERWNFSECAEIFLAQNRVTSPMLLLCDSAKLSLIEVTNGVALDLYVNTCSANSIHS